MEILSGKTPVEKVGSGWHDGTLIVLIPVRLKAIHHIVRIRADSKLFGPRTVEFKRPHLGPDLNGIFTSDPSPEDTIPSRRLADLIIAIRIRKLEMTSYIVA